MASTLAPIAALLLSTVFLLLGNGLQVTLLPVRAGIENFASIEIGLVGAAYFVGFAFGCYFGGRLVRRAGHIRTFSAMASLASAAALIHALLPDPLPWWLFRALSGCCFAVLYVVIESWLNERSDNENRGFVLSLYNAINLTVITIGQMMMVLYDPAGFALFVLASIMISLAVIPVSMTTAAPPAPIEEVRLDIRGLYEVSPVACVCAFGVGLANGAFWSLGPVFAQNRGFGITGIAVFMSVTVLAGALAQWPIGRLSDRRDRRRIIAVASAAAAASGLVIGLLPDLDLRSTFAVALVFGAAALPIYALTVAHMNDTADRGAFVRVASGILMVYAIGATIGPIPAALLMDIAGAAGLFLFTALVHGVLAVFAALRITQRAAVTPASQEPFVGVPRTSPALYALDPRSDEEPDSA